MCWGRGSEITASHFFSRCVCVGEGAGDWEKERHGKIDERGKKRKVSKGGDGTVVYL